jgi:hypothetical protein
VEAAWTAKSERERGFYIWVAGCSASPRRGSGGACPPHDRRPNVPTRVVASRDDRPFPPEFQRRVARDRFGFPVDEVPSEPPRGAEPADRLESSLAATKPVPS